MVMRRKAVVRGMDGTANLPDSVFAGSILIDLRGFRARGRRGDIYYRL